MFEAEDSSSTGDSEDTQMSTFSCFKEEESQFLMDVFAESPEVENQVSPLLELAADTVGRSFSCGDIDLLQSRLRGKNGHQGSQAIDGHLMKLIAKYSFPTDEKLVEPFVALSCDVNSDVWKLSRMKLNGNLVRTMTVFGFTAKASMMSLHMDRDEDDTQVELSFEKQQITSSRCSECQDSAGWCQHVLAAVLYHIRHPDKVKRYVTLTELLASLRKDQLQKVLQFTIADDPSSLERCLTTIETLQDKDSDINQSAGAPDMTEGFVDKDDRLTEMSKKTFLYQFMHTEETCYYAQAYDWESKPTSKFQIFIDKILAFIKVGNFKETVELLTEVMKELIQKLAGFEGESYQQLAHTLYDMAHTLALCLLHPGFPQPLKTDVINNTQYIQRSVPVALYTGKIHSPWSALPHLGMMCRELLQNSAMNDLGEGLEHALLGEVLATQDIPNWPYALTALTEGQVTWKESQYNENICLMLWRVESLMVTEGEAKHEKILRILPIILRKLTLSGKKMSVLGQLVSWEEIFDTNHSIPALRGLKYSGCKHVPKRRKLSPSTVESTLKKPELAYGLLYCLYVKDICEESSGKQFESSNVTLPFYWLALELSSSRMYSELQTSEHILLRKLEDRVAQRLLGHYEEHMETVLAQDCLHWYLSVLDDIISTLPHTELPLQLFSIMMALAQKPELYLKYDNVRDCVVRICSSTIRIINLSGYGRTDSSDASLTGAAAGQELQVGTSLDNGSQEAESVRPVLVSQALLNQDQYPLDSTIEAFFQCLDPTRHMHMLVEVLSFLPDLFHSTGLFNAERAYGAFEKTGIEATDNLDLAKAIFKFAVSAYKNESSLQSGAIRQICRYTPMLGIPCLEEIINTRVCLNEAITAFQPSHIADILLSLRTQISSTTAPEAMILLAMNYCFQHPIVPKNIDDLLAFYNLPCFTLDHLQDAVHHITTQTGPVASTVLFTVANFHKDKCINGEYVAGTNLTRRPVTTIEIIRKAFEMLRQEDICDCTVTKHLIWVYEYCTKEDVLWSDIFWSLLDIIIKNGDTHPEVIMRLLEGSFVDLSYIGTTRREVLADTLASALKSNLTKLVSNHRSSNYQWFAKEYRKAGQTFALLGEENKKKLNSVLIRLRCNFSRRKRLLKVIEVLLSENDKNTDTEAPI